MMQCCDFPSARCLYTTSMKAFLNQPKIIDHAILPSGRIRSSKKIQGGLEVGGIRKIL